MKLIRFLCHCAYADIAFAEMNWTQQQKITLRYFYAHLLQFVASVFGWIIVAILDYICRVHIQE